MIRNTALAAALGLAAPLHAGGVIEDFSGAPQSRWEFFSDQVMGGVSDGAAKVTNAGLHLTGTVSTDNNGGFIQARLKPVTLAPETQSITLEVKGNGAAYYVHLRTRGTMLPWRFYQAGFATDGTWQEVTLPLTAFTGEGGKRGALKAKDVMSLALVAYGANYEADIKLRRVSAD